MKIISETILKLAGKGKWYAIGVGTVLFGATWVVDLMWPNNPLQETINDVKVGLVSATTVQ